MRTLSVLLLRPRCTACWSGFNLLVSDMPDVYAHAAR
jgi:hypothetical protein